MAGDMYGPMTGAAAWMMTRRWDWPHMALLFAMWSAMMVGMMVPSAVAAIVSDGRTPRGTPAGSVAPTCAFVAAYVLVWMLFSLAATLAQRALYELRLLSPMMEPATTATRRRSAVGGRRLPTPPVQAHLPGVVPRPRRVATAGSDCC